MVVDPARSRTFALGRGFSLLVGPDPQPLPALDARDLGDPLGEAVRCVFPSP